MGDHFDEPVLLIKTAWGGHSLFKNFRSPSAGFPAEEVLQQELKQAQERCRARRTRRTKKNDPLPTMDDIKAPYGSSYRDMLAEVKDVIRKLRDAVSRAEGQKVRAGWFRLVPGLERSVRSGE